jgi:molybdate transport repressor ModE-like protein
LKELDQISLRQLRALDMVAQHGTITAAAQVMGLTGPAVHNQLKNLEEITGTTLLFREGRQRNTVTPQGQALLQAHRQMRATLQRALLSIAAIDQGRSGSVVLGAVSTAKYFAPKIVAMLDAEFPQIDIHLKVANRSETIAGLEKGEFDLCIMGRPPREPLTEAVWLAEHPHVLIARPDHPLAGRAQVRNEDLSNERFVLRESGSGTRLLASRYLEDLDDRDAPNVIEMGSNETIKQAVMNGLGIALISAHTVADEVSLGRLAVLNAADMPIMRSWYVLTPSELAPTKPAQMVRSWLVANSKAYIPNL